MNLEDFMNWLAIIGSLITIIGVIILVYKSFRDPDEKTGRNIDVMKAKCTEKHERIDEIISEIRKSIEGINYTFAHFKENEFRHIEQDMKNMSEKQTEILTIFKEREKNNK
jgi:hypothetical protein